MNVVITEEAKNDLFDAIDYYESEQVGLGVRLRDEFAEVSVSIGGNPLLWRETARRLSQSKPTSLPLLRSIRNS